ncbi:SurA N-terminal domain-containing protein [Parendozoicomonas sp. Alg238-R29]|uniref:SurA N-terminal domain-containing protein n=1 Tax=Parendozoicomonas sp. Alg238-R29 TaxID=2993446 RepID=UPI00248EDF17|nr:SurA N-terminal domain-containing protein [Parendozoicomonas sp. Alg238-R29]
MLQDMREKAQGWVAKVIVAAIAFTFAVFGLESLRPNTSNPDIATVGDETITQQQLLETMDQQRRMLIQQMGQNFDPSMLDDRLLQQSALESLVQRSVVRAEAAANDMAISDQMIDQVIRTAPEFQVDGSYNPDRVLQYVRSMGMSLVQFRAFLREEMIATQLRAGIAASEFMTAYELQSLSNLQNQTRDIAWMVLDAEQARKAVAISEDAIQALYEEGSSRFMQPEQVSIDYIVLNRDKLADKVEVSDEDIRIRYESRVAELKKAANEQVSASMILLEINDKRDEAAALAEAKDLRAKMDNGAQFADLAKEFSDDPESAAKGGSLGVVESGFFGDEFDGTLAALENGEVSPPVVAEFGVVIIRRDTASDARIPSLDQMRASLVKELREQAVGPVFVEKSQRLADISFEASDLAQPAETLGLEIMQTGLFGREGGEGVTANQAVVTAAFSEEVLNLGANSDLIEVAPGQVMVVRVREHVKAERKVLADVRAEIETLLRAKLGEEQLQEKASKLVTELSGGAEVVSVAKANQLTWQQQAKSLRFSREVPAQIVAEAFRMPHPVDSGSSFASASLPNGDIAVIRMSNVVPGTEIVSAEQMRMMGANLAVRNGTQLYDEYVRNLRERADVKLNVQTEDGGEG